MDHTSVTTESSLAIISVVNLDEHRQVGEMREPDRCHLKSISSPLQLDLINLKLSEEPRTR